MLQLIQTRVGQNRILWGVYKGTAHLVAVDEARLPAW
jgi:hypothetical protein